MSALSVDVQSDGVRSVVRACGDLGWDVDRVYHVADGGAILVVHVDGGMCWVGLTDLAPVGVELGEVEVLAQLVERLQGVGVEQVSGGWPSVVDDDGLWCGVLWVVFV